MKPLCFVIMPFGTKKDARGNDVDFDTVYAEFIRAAIEDAGMEPVRADEETVNGIIHKPMYERLILCDYAVADLTTSNANVLYELGIRHAVKPFTTITIFAKDTPLPFDVNSIRCLPYAYETEAGLSDLANDRRALAKKLTDAKADRSTDSPVYQLVDGISFQNSVAHQKTDIFREQVSYNRRIKDLLADTRSAGNKSNAEKAAAIDSIVQAEIDPENAETGVLIDVMLSYRAVSALDRMIAFINDMPAHVRNTVMVQEQLGFALNRTGRPEEAIRVLERVLEQHGPSSETYGILGRVYKDKYDNAVKEANEPRAKAMLGKAIDTYRKGMEADWRDAYPGINLLTLLDIKGDKWELAELTPVVRYAVERKIAHKTPDYWDYATLLEIAVISGNEAMADDSLDKALGFSLESWMPQTTIGTLGRLLAIREQRGEDTALVKKYLDALKRQA